MTGVRAITLFSSVAVLIAALSYVTGIFNPVTNAQRRIRKELKKYPEAISFHKWEEEHK